MVAGSLGTLPLATTLSRSSIIQTARSASVRYPSRRNIYMRFSLFFRWVAKRTVYPAAKGGGVVF